MNRGQRFDRLSRIVSDGVSPARVELIEGVEVRPLTGWRVSYQEEPGLPHNQVRIVELRKGDTLVVRGVVEMICWQRLQPQGVAVSYRSYLLQE